MSQYNTFKQALAARKFLDAARSAVKSSARTKAHSVRQAMQAALDAREAEQARTIATKFGDYIPDAMITALAALQLSIQR